MDVPVVQRELERRLLQLVQVVGTHRVHIRIVTGVELEAQILRINGIIPNPFHVQLVHILTQIVHMGMDTVHHITTVINQDIVHTGGVIQYMINIKPYKKWQKE